MIVGPVILGGLVVFCGHGVGGFPVLGSSFMRTRRDGLNSYSSSAGGGPETPGPPEAIQAAISLIASWSLTNPSQTGRAPAMRPAGLGPMTMTLERSHTSRQSD
jgi:hypothetical protein